MPPRDEEVSNQSEFVSAKYLEDFIVTAFEMIFKGKLRIYEGAADGVDGQQYATDIGLIDILAVDPVSRSFTVVEPKIDRPSDRVVGQALRYMGWVKSKLCKGGKP